MASINLMDLNDDVLRELCVVTAFLHSPHWQRKGPNQPHGCQPVPVFVRKSGPAPSRRDYPATFCLGWIYLAHVNRRLRQICLHSPGLWADNALCIPTSSRAVLETMIARARQVPLTMIATESMGRLLFPPSTTSKEYQKKLTLTLENLGRAAVCKVSSTRVESDVDWISIFDGRAFPHLHTLALDQSIDSNRFMPQRILSLTAPNLAELSLTSRLFPSFTTAIVPLRKLRISLDDNRVDRTALTSNDPLFDVLSRAPALETLRLVITFRPLAAFNNEVMQNNVKLVHLREVDMWMKGPFKKHTIWSKIEAPAVTKLRLHFDEDEDQLRVDPTIGLRSAASELLCPKLCVIVIKQIQEHRGVSLQLTALDDDADHSVFLGWRSVSDHIVEDTLKALPQFLVAPNITRLHVVGLAMREGDTSLAEFLRALPAVTDLFLDKWTYFVHSLVPLAAEPSTIPALRTLEVKHVWGTFAHYQTHWETFAALLQGRAAAGNPLRVVRLFGYRDARAEFTALDTKMIDVISTYVQEIVDDRPPLDDTDDEFDVETEASSEASS